MVSRVLPAEATVVVATPAMFGGELLREERAGTEKMVPKRLGEFTAGRIAARTALKTLGFPEAPLLVGPSRAPIWPEGAVGSISHTGSTCVAAVALKAQVHTLGLDLEEDTPLGRDLEPMVVTPEERAWLDNLSEGERGRAGKLIFSAKESVFKCWFPVEEQWLDFQDAAVVADPEMGTWSARIGKEPQRGFPSTVGGAFVRRHGLLITGAHVRAPKP